MNNKILIGSIIAVVLLVLVSFSSVVGYSSVNNQDNTIITDEYDNPTPIVLVLQLISKLRNHKDIQNVESEDDVLQIIEGDEELNSIVEQLFVEDCGCEEQGTTEWSFPIICGLLYPAAILSWVMFYLPMLIFGPNWPGFIGAFFYMIMNNIGTTLNCNWADM